MKSIHSIETDSMEAVVLKRIARQPQLQLKAQSNLQCPKVYPNSCEIHQKTSQERKPPNFMSANAMIFVEYPE